MTKKHEWVNKNLYLKEKTTGVTLYGTVCTDIEIIAKQMNDYVGTISRLEKENEDLKSELNDVGSSIEERVMKVIDNKINELETDLNRSVKAGMPTSSMYSEIELLEDLKKELKQ